MVTARHVVKKVGHTSLSVLVTRSSGEGVIVVKVGEALTANGLAWVEDEANDLAAAPMPTSPDFSIKAITPQNCLSMTDLVPSMGCLTVGCPYGLHGLDPQKATPLVLDGVISGIDPANRKIYTSAPTFPGNSGGPLIALRHRFATTVSFAGIMLQTVLLPRDPGNNFPVSFPSLNSGYAPLADVKSISSAISAYRFPPLHLGVAAPADSVLALLDSQEAKAVAGRVAALQPIKQ